MDQQDKELLIQVVDLIKNGDNNGAIKILSGVLAREPQLEQAWYLMGLALTDTQKKKFAFEQTIKLNPKNDRAKQQLLKLEAEELPKIPPPIQIEAPTPAPAPNPDAPVISTPWATGEEIEDVVEEEEEEIELPEWAKDIEPGAAGASFGSGDSLWQWRDDDYQPEEPEEVEPIKVSPFEQEEEEEEPEEKWNWRKLFFWMREEDLETDEFEVEEKKKKTKRKFRIRRQARGEPEEEEGEETSDLTLQEELLLEDEKNRFRWRPSKKFVRLVMFIIILTGLGGGAYFYQDDLIPLVNQYAPTVVALLTQEPTATPDYTPTMTFTPVFQPTMPPTWTPAVTESVSHAYPTLPTLEFTPTITPTPIPLQSSIASDMNVIERQLRAIRDLNNQATVAREIMPSVKFKSYMQNLAISRFNPEQAAQQELVLEALGYVANDYYPIEVMMNDLTDYLGGFFYPQQNKIYIPGNGFYEQEKYIYAYGYSYALLDRNFDILANFCQNGVDQCLAETALVDGDISFMQNLWQQTYLNDFRPREYYNLLDPEPTFQDYWSPEYFNSYRNFAARYGFSFLSYLYDDNGWTTVNYTYRYPPTTTEQVMHPEKYEDRENRVLLYDPDLLPVLEEGWQLVERGTLGEWRTYLLLAVPDYPDAVRPEAEAAQAAAGWGGDTYQVYTNPETGDVTMSVHWNWDTAGDQEEFLDAMSLSQAGRFQGTEYQGHGEGTCWMEEESGYSCLFQSNRDVLWLFSTNPAVFENILAAFGQFD